MNVRLCHLMMGLLGVLCLPERVSIQATAGELPTLDVTSPAEGKRLVTGASAAVVGSFTPAFNSQVQIQVFHVLDGGGLIRQAGFSFAPHENGKFGATIQPPAGGWIPGRSRMRVSLRDLPQVRRDLEFEVVGDPVLLPNATPEHDPKSSELVIKLPLEKVGAYELSPNVTYLVEGSFRPKRRLEGVEGPRILAQCLKILDDGKRVTADGIFGVTFCQPDGTCWYQIQLKTPETPGLYHMELRCIVPDVVEEGAFGPSELPFSIRVADGK